MYVSNFVGEEEVEQAKNIDEEVVDQAEDMTSVRGRKSKQKISARKMCNQHGKEDVEHTGKTSEEDVQPTWQGRCGAYRQHQ